ncbi:MAG: efflux RND transporter periplasmic adaptor subunit, partial [Bacteroidia bacterium]|nr:efflux RND transporter periplasmic adaptor subunit [Bacteroidia bacterium]
ERGTVVETFPIYTDHSGAVLSKEVNSGDYVRAGQVLFKVQDLSRLWVLFDVYESDLAGIQLNDKLKFTTSAMPSKVFEAKVKFIDPSVNAKTRVAKIRAEIDNSSGKLKPGMFVKGELILGGESTVEIFLPETAILWTGERSVVYVKTDAEVPTYEFREVVIGNSTTNGYFIKEGITIGDEVVVNGAFVIDAAAQLNNNKSMMNRDISVKHAAGHSHHGSVNAEEQEFKVYGNCSMCKKNIEASLKGVNGLFYADWDQESKMLSVQFDPEKVSTEEMKERIAAAGYDTETHKASDEAYESLPKCCQFEREE